MHSHAIRGIAFVRWYFGEKFPLRRIYVEDEGMLFGIGIPPGIDDLRVSIVNAPILPAMATESEGRLTAGEVLYVI
jgi:hypothetical protein